jgi:hypothetical protein
VRITADTTTYIDRGGVPRRYGNPSTECAAGEHGLDWSVTGPRGAQGPAGPSEARSQTAYSDPKSPKKLSGDYRKIVDLALPARGLWVISGKVVVVNNGAHTVCRLQTPAGGYPAGRDYAFSSEEFYDTLAFSSVYAGRSNHGLGGQGAHVLLRCRRLHGSGTPLAGLARVTAVRVGSLSSRGN